MNLFIIKLTQLRIGWNEKQLNEDDFYKLCRRFNIKMTEMPLAVHGFYYCLKGIHYIAISSKLKGFERLFTMWHEFAHAIQHIPSHNETANFYRANSQSSQKEKEADYFAACCLIPKIWVETKTLNELLEEECIPEEIIIKRKEIYEEYRI